MVPSKAPSVEVAAETYPVKVPSPNRIAGEDEARTKCFWTSQARRCFWPATSALHDLLKQCVNCDVVLQLANCHHVGGSQDWALKCEGGQAFS